MTDTIFKKYLIASAGDPTHMVTAYYHTDPERGTRTVKIGDIKLVNTGNGYEFSWEDKTTLLNYCDAADLVNALKIMDLESDNPAQRIPDEYCVKVKT